MKLLVLVVLGVIATAAGESQLVKDFKTGNIQFSADVYSEYLKSGPGNFLVCPLSAQVVLALLQSGAGGQTAHQLASGLHLPEATEQLHKMFVQLSPSLRGNEHYDLQSANKIYLKKGFTISDTYKSSAVDVFDAEIESIDFGKKAQAVEVINRWIEDKTDHKIKNMVNEGSLSEQSVAVLVNAMYFRAEWVHQFPFYATSQNSFYRNNQDKITVDRMSTTRRFNYYEDTELNAKFLEMPYEGGDVTMTIVLPNDKDGLSRLEGKIAEVLVAPAYEQELVMVGMPKFKINTEIKFKSILQELGITDMFGSSADFSAISPNHESLQVSEVLQKTIVDVHEKGTTAAAATIVMMPGAAPPPKDYKTFEADHPFIFYLKSQAGIMFVGRYVGEE